MENSKIQAVVKEVMQDQNDPRAKTSKLQALEEYEAYILKHFEYKSTLKAEATHRLGDLYMQLEMNTHRQKIREYRDRLGLYLRGTLQDRPLPPRIEHTKSVAIYEEILKQYPGRQGNDSVLYQLARGYSDEGRIDQAIEKLNRLIARYPKSPLLQESYFRMGEFYFAIQDYPRAIKAYQQTLQYPSEEFVEMALYKIGWSYFARSDYRRSIDAFLALLDRKTVQTESGQRQLLLYSFSEIEGDLLKEVIHTMLLAFDELGGSTQLAAYFTEKGHRDYEDYLYRSLADLYVSQERFGEAVLTLQDFLRMYPSHEEAPALLTSIIEIQTQRKKLALAVRAREDFIQSFGTDSAWSQQVSDTARLKVRPLLRETAYELVLHYFSQAQQTKHPEDYEKAIRWSQQFLRDFPQVIEATKVNFLLAEGLYDVRRYEEAAAQYEKTANSYPLHSHSLDAAYNILLAQDKNPKATPGEKASAILKFSNRYPQDPRVSDLLLKAAQFSAQEGDYTTAIEYAEKHLQAQPRDTDHYTAKKLMATSYFEQEDYERAAEELQELLSLSAQGVPGGLQIPPKDQEPLRSLLASSLYKQAESEKKKGNLESAAKRFLNLQEVMPGSEVASIALLDGALLQLDLDQEDQAIFNLERFIQNYPQSEHILRVRQQLAGLYERQEQFAKAIEHYEWLSNTKDPERSAEWRLTTARLAEKIEDWQRVHENLLLASDLLPSADDRALDALYNAAQVKKHLGERQEAQLLLTQVLERYARETTPTPRMAYTASRACYELGEALFDEFTNVRLVPPLETNLEKKRQLLKEAMNYYSQTMDYKVAEYITASTYKVGILFEEFRNALLDSERPAGLTDQQLEQYNFLLEEEAFPFEENAIAAFETNIRRLQEGGPYDQWVQKSYQRLAHLLPARYARDEMEEIITQKPLF